MGVNRNNDMIIPIGIFISGFLINNRSPIRIFKKSTPEDMFFIDFRERNEGGERKGKRNNDVREKRGSVASYACHD